ncbi:MAG: hypothetical protein ACRD2J_14695, partial [Thermoanaerobaculia bacterium]
PAARPPAPPPAEVGVAEPFPSGESGPPPPAPAPEPPHMDVADVGADVFSGTPVPAGAPAQAPVPAGAPAQAPSEAVPPPEVKRLKVRSSIDIMAELEQLRKRATQTAAVRRKDSGEARSETERAIALPIPEETIDRARRVRLSVAFEDADGNVVRQEERTVEVDEGERLRRVTVDLSGGE